MAAESESGAAVGGGSGKPRRLVRRSGDYAKRTSRTKTASQRVEENEKASRKLNKAITTDSRGREVAVFYNFSPKSKEAREKDKAKFLRSFAESQSVSAACFEIKRTRATVYQWKKDDAEFARAWDEIWEAEVDKLETTCMNRAIRGYTRPVYQNGQLVGTETVHNPQMSIFMLQKNRRRKYDSDGGGGEDAEARIDAMRAAAESLGVVFRRATEEELKPLEKLEPKPKERKGGR